MADSLVGFCDVESSGLMPWPAHEPWEVGLILPSGEEIRWFLPVDLGRADPFGLGIGRFHERHPHGYAYEGTRQLGGGEIAGKVTDYGLCTTDKFCKQFAKATFGLHLCGAVISFDLDKMLGPLLRANGQIPGWHYHSIEIEAMVAGFLVADAYQLGADGMGHPDKEVTRRMSVARPPWDSNELSREVGVFPDKFERHSALGDCRWAKALWEAMMGDG